MREQAWILVGCALAAGFVAARLVKAQSRTRRTAYGGMTPTYGDERLEGGRYSRFRDTYQERQSAVQEASEESFPASDAPSFNPGVTGGPPRSR